MAQKRIYDSGLEEKYHRAHPHLVFHPKQSFPWVTKQKQKPFELLMNSVNPVQKLQLIQLASQYHPDFYCPQTGTYIETKGILRTVDRMKLQQVVSLHPSTQFKLVVQMSRSQNTKELVELLQTRNQAVSTANSTHYATCMSVMNNYFNATVPPGTKRTTLSGVTLLRWGTNYSSKLQVETYSP